MVSRFSGDLIIFLNNVFIVIIARSFIIAHPQFFGGRNVETKLSFSISFLNFQNILIIAHSLLPKYFYLSNRNNCSKNCNKWKKMSVSAMVPTVNDLLFFIYNIQVNCEWFMVAKHSVNEKNMVTSPFCGYMYVIWKKTFYV